MTLTTAGWIGQERRRFDRIRVEHADLEEALRAMEAHAEALGADAVIGLEPQVDASGEPPIFIILGTPVQLNQP